MIVEVLVVTSGIVLFPLPIPIVPELAVTLNEFPAKTVSPELFTAFTALKFDLVCPNLASVVRTELFPSVRMRSCV
jgi:hypothetical protein